MNKQLTIKGPLSKDFQQIYIDDEATNIFINNEGKIKSSSLSSNTVDGEVTIGDNNQLHLNDNTIISRSSSDLEIIATAGIDLEPENGVIQFINKDGNNHTIIGNIQIDGAGLTIAPINLGNLTIDAGGSITQDSGLGRFVASKAGTEFSATNSAYAGMILGYTRIANDSTTLGNNFTTINSSSMTVLQTDQGTNFSIQFTVPPSGNVEIQCSFWVTAVTGGAKFSLSTGTSYAELDETHTYDADQTFYIDETDHYVQNINFAVTGLTAGTDTTYYLAGLASEANVHISHGRNRSSGTHGPPIILKAVALPATITTGE
jgi:hypothetical protein